MLNQQKELEQFEWFIGLLHDKCKIFQYALPFGFVRKVIHSMQLLIKL